MSERGGPTTQSGIIYQNSIAALFLGRLCDKRERSPEHKVVAVRIEAPTAVDDIVVTYQDGHRHFIQAKEKLSFRGEVWQNLWNDFADQFYDQSFQRGKDRLRLHCGERSDELNNLKDACQRAATSADQAEMFSRVTTVQQELLQRVKQLMNTNDEGLLLLVSHLDVELTTMEEIERDLVPHWIPESNKMQMELFRLLRDRVGRAGRVRDSFTLENLCESLKMESDVIFRHQPFDRRSFTETAKDGAGVNSTLVERVKEASSELTANSSASRRLAGRSPIALQAIKLERKSEEPGEVLSFDGIQSLLMAGHRLLLEASAGRGKSTTLVQLAKQTAGVIFLIDLPTWAKSKQNIIQFLVGKPAFQSRGINAEMLAKLSDVEPVLFLLNGWNEIPETYFDDAVIAVRELVDEFPKAGIIVATRTHHVIPPLAEALRVKLLPLDKAQRAAYLRQRLDGRADELISKLDNDPVLDELTQTFLFLAEIATIFESGRPIPPTKMGVLNEAIHLLEQSEEHSSHLQRPPLKGRTSEYLEGLATQMTTQGATRVLRQEACAFISSVSRRLRDAGQVESPPDPDDILNTLCAHHILERPDYSSEAISFEHQQFQEFYAAQSLKEQLGELVQSNNNQDRKRDFTKQYVNERSWEEPLCMIAEEIGASNTVSTIGKDAAKTGKLLVEMARSVDPIFAAQLARLCGEAVWKQVQTAVGRCLRSWYAVDDEHHRQCAVAGMLASGSAEFSDILLPLLNNDDQQVRLRTYRAGTEFHLSSLGAKWREVVRDWDEEARMDFISELADSRCLSPEAAKDFALTDPSPIVRMAAIRMLSWNGTRQDRARLLEALDEEGFEEVVQRIYVEMISPSQQSRARTVYQKLLNESADAMDRIRFLLRLGELGDTGIPEKLNHELTQLPPDNINDRAEPVLQPALKIVQSIEPEWVSDWVARQITDGLLRQESWIPFVTCISESLKAKLLNRVACEELGYYQLSDFASVLAATGDFTFVEAVFAKLCDVRRGIDETRPQDNAKRTIARQFEYLFRSFPPNVAIAGLSSCFAKEFDATEFTSVIEIISGFDNNATNLRSQLQDALRQKLRAYLKSGVQFALQRDDRFGTIKGRLATALAKVGDPEDMLDLQQIIRADTEKFRNADVYIRAVASLDSERAETVLLGLLQEYEYENQAASALARLATFQDIGSPLSHKTDYCVIWEARAGHQPSRFDEGRRKRYAIAIKQRISLLINERANGREPIAFDYRLIELAKVLANLDADDSAELVSQVIDLAKRSNEFMRVRVLEALLFGGAALPTQVTLNVLNSVIDHIRAWGLYTNQNEWLLSRCLWLLPFVDDPAIGIDRIGPVISEMEIPFYMLRDVTTALGCSRSQEALVFLCELARTNKPGLEQIAEEWINAVAALDGPGSGYVLLGFIDPDTDGFHFKVNADNFPVELLASHIANIARAEPEMEQRLFQLCESQLPPSNRDLLAKVIAQLGTVSAVSAGLTLIDDAAPQPIPYDLRRALERGFVQQRPHAKSENTFTLVPRSSNAIRTKLFEMALKDDKRKQSAFNLLGQIEVWRLDYGRSETEPRHPLFVSGEPWPLGLSR